ncbi:MAG: UbiX family flavin prenyltransferase [bacterium]
MKQSKEHIVVAVTGASGSVYALGLIKWLVDNGYPVELIASDTGKKVFEYETGKRFSADTLTTEKDLITIHDNDNLFSPLSSGSYKFSKIIIVPCSMGTLGRIATGSGTKLIERVADVALKERRRLVIVPRETPLNTIHLENMLKLSSAGAIILPAIPAFYHKPKTIDDMVSFIVSKILDAVDIPNNLYKRWTGKND